MCNRTEVLGALATYPESKLPTPQGGATCRHGLIFQTRKGFLSGDYIDAEEGLMWVLREPLHDAA